MELELKESIDNLVKALKSDSDYYMSWQANIAMAVYDALPEPPLDKTVIREACNKGAKSFLDTFINMK